MDIKSVPETYSEQLSWLQSMGRSLIEKDEIRNITVMQQCEILYYVHQAWTNDVLGDEAKSHWEYDFYKWAKAFAQRRGKQPADITIDNQISVYRDYIALGIIEPPAYVEIQARDEQTGMPIEGRFDRVEVDFKTCDYTKLLIARRTAKAGEMTPKMWSKLFDPRETTTALTAEIKQIPQADNLMSFYERDGVIFVKTPESGSLPLVEIIDDDSDQLTWQEGLDKLLSAVNIHIGVEHTERL